MQYKTLFVVPNRVQLGLVAAKNITGVKFKTYPFCFWVIFAIFGPSGTPVPTRTIYFKTGRRGAVPYKVGL